MIIPSTSSDNNTSAAIACCNNASAIAYNINTPATACGNNILASFLARGQRSTIASAIAHDNNTPATAFNQRLLLIISSRL